MKKSRILSIALAVCLLTNLFTLSSALAETPTKIVVMMPALGPVPAGLAEVEAAINEIAEQEINVTVELNMVSVAEYGQQLGLMISSGEPLDLAITLPMGSSQFTTMISQGQLTDISALLEEYGQGILTQLDSVQEGLLKGTTVGDSVFGVTSLYNKVSNIYWLCRQDMLDKYAIDLDNVKTLTDIANILETIKTNEPGMVPLVPGSGGATLTQAGVYIHEDLTQPVYFDCLGDSTNRIGIALLSDTGKVILNYATDDYKASMELMHEWYEKGYVYKDGATMKDTAETIATAGNVFSWFCESEQGVEANKSAQVGFAVKALKISTGVIATNTLTKFVWAVPATSAQAQSAVQFMNLMYSDARIANLLAWGIEGRDYVLTADGTAAYPDGVTAQTVAYHTNDFMPGNQYLIYPWTGNPANLRDLVREENKTAPKSELLGFSYDSTNMANEISAVTNVIAEYRQALESGTTDPDEYLPKFIQALKDAGADTLIADMQAQLDAFLAGK